MFSLVSLALASGGGQAFTPYTPTVGWTYYLEAAHPAGPATTWPACPFRFLSFPSQCNAVNLWSGAGVNQQFTLAPGDEPGTFTVHAGCGHPIGYSASCEDQQLTLGAHLPGQQHAFRFVQNSESFEWTVEAARRSTSCAYRWLSFPTSSCDATGPVPVMLQGGGGEPLTSRFRIHTAAGPTGRIHATNTDQPCADPFVWATGLDEYSLVCTGGLISYSTLRGSLGSNATFVAQGTALPASPPQPEWASSGNRWAPETTTLPSSNGIDSSDGSDARGPKQSLLFFSDSQPTGPRRVGWAWAAGGAGMGQWNRTASHYMDLGQSKAGEIDQHIFRDANGSTYIVWKTDDNSLQEKLTRIWIQEIVIETESGTVRQLRNPLKILDSSGMWWVDSFVPGGALVEGPEIVQHNGYYYLFFAAGKFCQGSYSEGVARSRSVFGPYEKLGVPLLSTGMVGYAYGPPDSGSDGSTVVAEQPQQQPLRQGGSYVDDRDEEVTSGIAKLIGPGHASFVQDLGSKQWFAVYHASRGANCNRFAFVDEMVFGSDDWPRIAFSA